MQFSQRILVCRCFAKSTLDLNFSSLTRSRLNFTELMCMERIAEIREKVTKMNVDKVCASRDGFGTRCFFVLIFVYVFSPPQKFRAGVHKLYL